MSLKIKSFAVAIFALSIAAQAAFAQNFAQERLNNWHQWRGPDMNGFAPKGNPPTEWSATKNIKWKSPIPGEGVGTPIVWGDRIFILTAIPQAASEAAAPTLRVSQPNVMAQPGQPPRRGGGAAGPPPTTKFSFDVLCLDRRTGDLLWQKTARSVVPHEGHHPTSTFASTSPVTDGQRLYVSFGSRGIYCYDLAGDQKWTKDLGLMKTKLSFGEGASPALYNDTLVLPWDHDNGSFIIAYDAASGNEKWRTPRDEQTTWATPLIVPHAGRVQVITNGQNRVRSYDLADGSLIWECGGQGPNPIPTPVLVDNNVVVMTGYTRFAAYSIPLDSKGDLTNTDKPTWKVNDFTPYVASPLLYDGIFYLVKDRNNLFSTLNARTGEVLVDKKRLPDVASVYASPVGAAGRVYICSLEGTIVVLEHGPQKEMKVIRTNKISDDAIAASPAIVGNELFLRTGGHLYCIAETP